MKSVFAGLVVILFTFSSCEKEVMTYEGENCIFFDVKRGAEWIEPALWGHQYFSTASFGSTMDNDITMSLEVCASGMPSAVDRSFDVEIVADSTQAVNGEDFDGLQDTYVIKAGETNTFINLTFHRTARMDGDTLQLQLRLKENSNFKLMYTDFESMPGHYSPDQNLKFDYNHDASIHNIFIYDVLSKPKQWYGNDVTGLGTFGAFSGKKWRLMMELSGTTIDDYASETTMPSNRMSAIGEIVAKYLLAQAKKKEPVLDEDGTMMYVMAVGTLGGNDAWTPFTKPEDYYK